MIFFLFQPHPKMIRLYQEANIKTLMFEASDLPCLVPPKPWSSNGKGGYMLHSREYRSSFRYCKYWDCFNITPWKFFCSFHNVYINGRIKILLKKKYIFSISLSLFFTASMIKEPEYSVNYSKIFDSVQKQQIFPIYDSINLLSSSPWIINKQVC